MKVYFLFFFTTNLSTDAITAGSNTSIKMLDASVPSEIVVQIFAATADEKHPTIKVTIIRIDALVIIV